MIVIQPMNIEQGAWKVIEDADKKVSIKRGEGPDADVISGFFTGVLDAATWVRAQGGHAYDVD